MAEVDKRSVERDASTTRDPIALARRNWEAAGWSGAADGMAFITSIMRVQQVYLARIEAILRPHELSFSRYEVLRLLAFSRRGRLPIGKVGERLQVHAASVTNAVQRLEHAGLVRREANPDDGRGVLVHLLPAGAELVERCTELLNREVFTGLDLDDGDVSDVTAALTRLRQAFGDFG